MTSEERRDIALGTVGTYLSREGQRTKTMYHRERDTILGYWPLGHFFSGAYLRIAVLMTFMELVTSVAEKEDQNDLDIDIDEDPPGQDPELSLVWHGVCGSTIL